MGPPRDPSFNLVSHIRLTILVASGVAWPSLTTPISTCAENGTIRSVGGAQGTIIGAKRLFFPQLRFSRGFWEGIALLWSASKYSCGTSILNTIRNRCPCRIHAEKRAGVVLHDLEGFFGWKGAAKCSPTLKERLWKCNESNMSGVDRLDSCSSPEITQVLRCCGGS